ncbi:uncharacterized protein [Littorina saxatilis]|uniref:Uncharacterized protein n=1 Tax=Littorina saxatilis TaxID=31220 RepID=A0AAN9G8Z0_9CAEN
MATKKNKQKFIKKDKNVHLDGIKRIRCPQGITEKDISTFFEHQQKEWGQVATQADHLLHEQALELLRAHKTFTFQNAELTIVGEFFAVRFVAGKGRRKFRIERFQDKIKLQVHVENLLFGFIRLLLFLSLLLETAGCVLSVASVNQHDLDEDMPRKSWTLVTFFTIIGDVFRGILACLAAMETINSSPALFVPTYGRSRVDAGRNDGVGNHGVGVWPLGHRRWLFRAVVYAAVASSGQLNRISAQEYMLPEFVLHDGLVYSGWVLMVASVLSSILHVLHVFVPSLLKSPWTSVSVPSVSSPPVPSAQEKDIDIEARDAMAKFHTLDKKGDISAFGKEQKEVKSVITFSGRSCCPVSMTCQRHPCTVSLGLTAVGVFLCAVTALTLFACHVARLVQTFVPSLQSTFTPVINLPFSLSAVVLCWLACVAQTMGFLQIVVTSKFGATVALRESMLLNVASLSTLWSRDVVTWLTEVHGLSKEHVGIAMVAGSVTSLVIPLLLVMAEQILACRRKPSQERRPCFSCRLRAIPREHVQSGLYMVAVLLSRSGMALAVLSLSLPVARVKSEYEDSLLEAVGNLSRVQAQAENHYNRMIDLFNLDVCGGPDIALLKRELKDSRQAAAILTVAQLRDHCNQLGFRKSVQYQDIFCERYGAARLFFAGDIGFNTTLHDRSIRDAKSANQTVQNRYLADVIDRSRARQLRTLDEGETELTPGAFKAYEPCLVGLCIAENAALIAMLIPFAGIAAQFVFLGIAVLEAVVRLLIKLSKLQTVFLDLKLSLAILMAKFNYYEEEKTLQFSLVNFNLIYLAYPALLTGCVGILVGFWYRKGAAVAHRRRASLVVVLPLVFFNVFGLGMTIAWSQIVSVLGEVAPMIKMTVTPLAALVVLRISYILTLLACFIFLLLAFLHHRHVRRPEKDAKPAGRAAICSSDSDTMDERKHVTNAKSSDYMYKKVAKTSTTTSTDTELSVLVKQEDISITKTHTARFEAKSCVSSKAATIENKTEGNEKPAGDHKKGKTNNKKVKITQGVAPQGSVWVLAVLIALGATCVVSVIIWRPVFAFDFDFNADMRRILKRVEKRLFSTEVARDTVYDMGADRCSLVDLFVKAVMENYMKALKNMLFGSFKQILSTIDIKVQITALPSLHLIQIPLLLAVYVPSLIITWAAVSTKLRPAWTPSPRFCARLTNTMAWLSLGWLVNGVLFLTAIAQSEVVPMFRVQVYTGEGLAFAMAANVMLLMVSQELRIGSISPVL